MPSYKAVTKMTREEALKLLERLKDKLAVKGFTEMEVAGSIRRGEAYIGDIDLIVEAPAITKNDFADPEFEYKEGGESRITFLFEGQQINVFAAQEDNWGAFLFYLTGPTNYAIAYRAKASAKNWKLNQYGLFNEKGEKIAGKTEVEIYAAFDKNYKAPEKRGKR